jgi:hypothetical protein
MSVHAFYELKDAGTIKAIATPEMMERLKVFKCQPYPYGHTVVEGDRAPIQIEECLVGLIKSQVKMVFLLQKETEDGSGVLNQKGKAEAVNAAIEGLDKLLAIAVSRGIQ